MQMKSRKTMKVKIKLYINVNKSQFSTYKTNNN